MTSGAASGTSGKRERQVFWLLWAGLSLFMLVNNTINAMSQTTDMARAGERFHPAEPYIWEYTSAVVAIVLIPAIAWALKFAPPKPGGWLKFFAVHIPASGAFSIAHVLGFHALRHLVYLAFGSHYRGALDLGYEYPKDARGYLTVLAVFWLGGQLATMWDRADATRSEGQGPRFDIRDGSKLFRTPVTDIVAARSAGNYVEFHLADGRRPLMRATLAGIEEQLKPHGFLRTHRSWLVNPLRVRGMTAEGSGDWNIELDGGAEAPLSRRFPEALSALRTTQVVA